LASRHPDREVGHAHHSPGPFHPDTHLRTPRQDTCPDPSNSGRHSRRARRIGPDIDPGHICRYSPGRTFGRMAGPRGLDNNHPGDGPGRATRHGPPGRPVAGLHISHHLCRRSDHRVEVAGWGGYHTGRPALPPTALEGPVEALIGQPLGVPVPAGPLAGSVKGPAVEGRASPEVLV